MTATGDRSRGLTGVWQGIYDYPTRPDSTPFTATLIDTGSRFSGSTHETCDVATSRRATLHAFVEGARVGQSVSFTKTYDGSGGWNHSVDYNGVINADATEISGRWRVRGGITGQFVMTRPASKVDAVTRRAFAKV